MGVAQSFAQFFAKLEGRFGKNKQTYLQKALETLKLSSGKVGLDDWRDFTVKFKHLIFESGELSEEMAYRTLVQKLPAGLLKWISDKEIEEEKKNPNVGVTFPCEPNQASVKKALGNFAGKAPKALEEISPTKWRVTWEEKQTAEKILSINGQKLKNQVGVMRVKLMEMRLTMEEVMTLITDKLETTERRHLKMPAKEEKEKESKSSRRIRVVEGEQETEALQEKKKSREKKASAESRKIRK